MLLFSEEIIFNFQKIVYNYNDKPDYVYLRKMFKELFYREKYEWDYLFDWCCPIDVKEFNINNYYIRVKKF